MRFTKNVRLMGAPGTDRAAEPDAGALSRAGQPTPCVAQLQVTVSVAVRSTPVAVTDASGDEADGLVGA